MAATQAAWRFLNNNNVGLRALASPLIEAGREEVATACDRYALLVHDWSLLRYPEHTSKRDRMILSSKRVPEGYKLLTALLVSDRHGAPLAPIAMSLRASDGVHCSRVDGVLPAESTLDQLAPVMTFAEQQQFLFPLVHVIDAEADSVAHYRQWNEQPGRYFLVRADDRLVEHTGSEMRCSAIRDHLHQQEAFRNTREIEHQGRKAWQWVAEVPVRLLRPGQRNRPSRGDRRRIPGAPLALRLVIAEARDAAGEVLASWYLLSNVPEEVDAATIALWYYHRWNIESYFKLLKSAGMNLENWRQESASAIARRLLVASMACVTVWRLARSKHPQAEPARRLLVRLSGRQMKHGRSFTMPALLAGLWMLLAMCETLETYSLEELRHFATLALNPPRPP